MVDKNLQYITDSLQSVLLTAITIKEPHLKVSAIGQAIMQAEKPRTQIAPSDGPRSATSLPLCIKILNRHSS